MEISLDLPDTAALLQLDQTYLKEALVVTLYHMEKLSEKEACLTLGSSRCVEECATVWFPSGRIAGDYCCEPEVASDLSTKRKSVPMPHSTASASSTLPK